MAALTHDRITPELPWFLAMDHEFPVAGNAVIQRGAIVCLNAAGFLAPGATSTTLVPVGRAEDRVDNTGGANGAVRCKVRSGIFAWENSAGPDLVSGDSRGKDVYLVDDQTVAKTSASSTRSRAGQVYDVLPDGRVWVAMGYPWSTIAGASPAVTTEYRDMFTATASQTLFETTRALTAGEAADSLLTVNGVVYPFGVDYIAVGNQATWLDSDFVMGAGFRVGIHYGMPDHEVNSYSANAAQTLFTLTGAPIASERAASLLTVNGLLYEYGTHYTIAGSTLTWLDVDFAMQSGFRAILRWGGSPLPTVDKFTATHAQTAFALSGTPTNPDKAWMFVSDGPGGGALYEYGADFTISGSTLTWADAEFAMTAGMRVVVYWR